MQYFLALILCFTVSYSQNGVTLLSHKNIPHGTSPQGTYFSSCWGWTSPEGEEFAFIGTALGTGIYSLAGDTLREIQFISGPQASYAYREFKTYKHYLYIVSEGGSGVQIVNLEFLPDTALLVKNFNYTSGGKNISRSHTVTLADGYLYLNGCANWSPGGMVIFSLLNDPTTPQYVGQYQPEYIHDSYVRNDTIFAAAIYGNGGLYIANAQNKANPTLIKKVSYTGSGTHHAWESIDGNYAFTTDEIGTVNNLKIWKFKNLGAGPPYTPIAQYAANAMDIIHNVHGRGNYVYVSHYGAGARVVNAQYPETPNEVGYYDTYPGSVSDYVGCWAVYPYFFSGKWIASDMQSGLYLMNFNELKPRNRPSLLYPNDGDSVGNSPTIFRWTKSTDNVEDPHWYELRISNANFSKRWKTNDTSFTISDFTGMQFGQLYQWEVWVVDEYSEVKCNQRNVFVFNGVSVGINNERTIPQEISLSQNYPNPFNPETKISFTLSKEEQVTLKIFNLIGEEVTTLIDGIQPKGNFEIVWNANEHTSGIYLYRLTVGNTTETKKMLLTK
ncbi:MAG: choice-of-anchor B family protein [Ignavibacteria bacterium]|nr:choice-of-anchor B family protein [Ignavibacteria bacterium]